MILIDETKLTYGTLSMIGQDCGIKGFNPFEMEDYAEKVVETFWYYEEEEDE